jgi:hypothetical protein
MFFTPLSSVFLGFFRIFSLVPDKKKNPRLLAGILGNHLLITG